MFIRFKSLNFILLLSALFLVVGCGEEVVDDNEFFMFSILGVQGGSDGLPDQWLTANTDPRLFWEPSITAIGYKAEIRNQAGSTVICPQVDTTNTNFTFAGCTLTNGAHYKAYVSYTDPNSNVIAAKNDGFEFIYDSIAPTVSLTATPSDPSGDTNPQLSFSSADSATGVAQTLCQFDGGGYVPCTSPHNVIIVSLGLHTFDVQAIDGAGNVSSLSSYSWTVDPTAPGPFNILGIQGGSDIIDDAYLTGGLQPKFYYESATFAVSYNVTVKDSSGTLDVCSQQSSINLNFNFAGCSLVEGTAYIGEVVAVDDGGALTEATNSPFSFTVDTVGPISSIDGSPSLISTEASPSFSFSAIDTTSSVGGYECQMDAGGFMPCSSPKALSSLGDGPHVFDVRAVDTLGNMGSSVSYSWTIDATAPSPFAIDGVIGGSDLTKDIYLTQFVQPELHWGASVDATSYDLFIKDTAGVVDVCTQLAVVGLSYQFVGCPLVEGATYKVLVVAKDAVGNSTNASNALFSLIVDSVVPAVSIDAAPSVASSDVSPSFQFSGSDGGSGVDHYECQLDGAGFAPCISPKTYSSLSELAHAFDLKAFDSAGNISLVSTHNWTIDSTAPGAFTIDGASGGSDVTNDEYLTQFVQPKVAWQLATGADSYDVTIKDFAGVTDVCSQLAVVGSEHQFSGCPLVEGVSYKVSVVAKDSSGNATSATNDLMLLMLDSVAPVTVLDITPSVNSNDSTPTFQFSGTDAASGVDYVECQLDGGGYFGCTSPDTHMPLGDGSHTYDVKAFDIAGNEGAVVTHTWTIDTVDPGLFNVLGVVGGSDIVADQYLTSGVSAKFNWGTSTGASSYEVTVRDSGNTIDVCSLQVTSDIFLDFSACTLQDETSYIVKVDGVDLSGNRTVAANSPYSFTVDQSAPVLLFTAVPAATSTQSTLDIEFSVTDGGTGISLLECDFDSAGYSACTSPHALSGVAAGVHSFSVRATDGAGNVAVPISHNWTTIAGAFIEISDTPTFDYGIKFMGSQFDKVFTLTNTGVMDAINIVESTLAAPFSFKGGLFPGSGGSCTSTLVTAGSCTVVIEFAPTSSGLSSGLMTVNYDDGTNNLSSVVALNGTGQVTAANVITNLQVISAKTFEIEIAWTAPFDNYTAISDYVIEYKESASSVWTVFADSVSADNIATVTGLAASTNYDFRVSSDNGLTSAPSNIVTGETTVDVPFFEAGVYKAMNTGGATSSAVAAMDDVTEIKLNGAVIATINAGQTHTFTSALNDVIEADKPIFVAGRNGAFGITDSDKGNIVWSTPDWAGKSFVFTATRLAPHKINIFAFEDANITIKKGATTVDSQFVVADGSHTFSINDYGGFEIISDGLIVTYFYSSSGGAVADPRPLLPASSDIIGFPSTKLKLTSLVTGTNYTAYHSNSQTSSGSLTAGVDTTINPQGTTSLFQSESVRIIADGKVVGNSNADTNGYCSAAFLPVTMMRKRYVLNVEAEWIAFASVDSGTITVTDPGGGTSTLTLTRSGTDPAAPYKVRTVNSVAGTRFESVVRFGAWYEPKSDNQGADNDETIMFGVD